MAVETCAGGSNSIIVGYRTHRKSNSIPKVYDITVNDISQVATYRVTFASTIHEIGVASLIERLRVKNVSETISQPGFPFMIGCPA